MPKSSPTTIYWDEDLDPARAFRNPLFGRGQTTHRLKLCQRLAGEQSCVSRSSADVVPRDGVNLFSARRRCPDDSRSFVDPRAPTVKGGKSGIVIRDAASNRGVEVAC